jgi:hypothetical protein
MSCQLTAEARVDAIVATLSVLVPSAVSSSFEVATDDAWVDAALSVLRGVADSDAAVREVFADFDDDPPCQFLVMREGAHPQTGYSPLCLSLVSSLDEATALIDGGPAFLSGRCVVDLDSSAVYDCRRETRLDSAPDKNRLLTAYWTGWNDRSARGR